MLVDAKGDNVLKNTYNTYIWKHEGGGEADGGGGDHESGLPYVLYICTEYDLEYIVFK